MAGHGLMISTSLLIFASVKCGRINSGISRILAMVRRGCGKAVRWRSSEAAASGMCFRNVASRYEEAGRA